jgi:hypothetical protein
VVSGPDSAQTHVEYLPNRVFFGRDMAGYMYILDIMGINIRLYTHILQKRVHINLAGYEAWKNLSLPASTWTHKVKHEGLWVHTPYISIPHDPFWIMTHSESLQFESDRTVARSTPAFLMLSWNRSFLFCSSCGPKWVIWSSGSSQVYWNYPRGSDWNVNMAPIPPENVHSRIMKNGKWKQHQEIQGFIQQ